MMHLFYIWRRSLSQLQFESFKSFIFINFKSLNRFYPIFFKYTIIWLFLAVWYFQKYREVFSNYSRMVVLFLSAFLLFQMIVLARSSVKQKKFESTINIFFCYPASFIILFLLMISRYALPFILLVAYFYFDSSRCLMGLVYSIKNAMVMVIYNAPLFILYYFLFIGFVFIFRLFNLDLGAFFLLLPIFVTLLMTFYQKRLYDNFTIYKIL